MADRPAIGTENWGDAYNAYINTEHNADGSHNIPEVTASVRLAASTQTIPTATWTKIELNNDDFDTDSIVDESNNRLVPPAGYYLVKASVSWSTTDSVDGARHLLAIRVDGAKTAGVSWGRGGTGAVLIQQVYDVVLCDGDTYIEAYMYHNAGVDQYIQSGTVLTHLECFRIGDA